MTMLTAKMSADEIDGLRQRNPDVFKRGFWKRYALAISVAVSVLYVIYCFWFFSIIKVFNEANWSIAENYLADWVSYEVRPDIDYRNGEIEVEFPRFSPLGENPSPDWIETREGTVRVISSNSSAAQAPASSAPSFMSPNSPASSNGGGTVGEADQQSGGQSSGGMTFMSPNSPASSSGNTANDEPSAATGEAPVFETRTGTAEATVRMGGGTRVEVTAQRVEVTHKGEVLVIDVDPQKNVVTPRGELPSWALQKREGAKVFLDFGFYGRAEVRAKETKIARRYLGWENFVFDTRSPYWGMSFSEIFTLVFTGPRIEDERSNWSLMWDNIINNAEWQHGDVWIKLLQTIVMAFVGTLFAMLVAFPLSFLAARNITPNVFLNQVLKRFFDFTRSVDMLIWALFFTRAFGPGPLAGISAIFFTDTGTFGKLYSEALENIDEKQREGVKSVGASNAQVQRFGVVPQVLPIFISQALYFWESNTRSATIIGAVGAGGIGLKLWEAMRTNQDWENVAYMVILILIVVFIFDNISNALRQRLTGRAG